MTPLDGCLTYKNGFHYFPLEISDSKRYEEEEASLNNTVRAKQLRTAALVTSWVSVIFALISGLVAIAVGQIFESESLFGYGLDGVLDSLSSVAVLWRFYGSASPTLAEAKERKACIVIAIFFLVSAFSLIFKSTKAIIDDDRENETEQARILTDAFSAFCGVAALIVASVKVYLGRRLNSRALLTDSIITYVGAVMSFLGVLGLELYESDDRVWYLDAIFGICCGVFLFCFGVKLLIQLTCLYDIDKEDLMMDDEE
ncbi:hypothetical protein BsWGS_22716 [Bradybaena similaris]